MPKVKKDKKDTKDRKGPHKHIKRYTEPYHLATHKDASTRKSKTKTFNLKRKPLDFDGLTRCFDAGTLNPNRVIDEIELDRVGAFTRLKRGGYKMCAGGAPSFDRVINVVVGDASAAAINRIHELGGSIRTRSLPKKEEAVNQKLTRPSKDERQNPKIENQGAVGHQATSTADEDLSDESPHEGGVRLGSV